jgi:hypothetical protein
VRLGGERGGVRASIAGAERRRQRGRAFMWAVRALVVLLDLCYMALLGPACLVAFTGSTMFDAPGATETLLPWLLFVYGMTIPAWLIAAVVLSARWLWKDEDHKALAITLVPIVWSAPLVILLTSQ